MIAWYFVSGREMVESWVEVRIQRSGMAEDLVIRDPGLPNTVNVLVRGPKGLLRSLDVRALDYSLDLSGLTPGSNVLSLDKEDLPFPYTFEILEIDPALIQLDVEKLTRRVVPVEAQWNGTIPEEYWLVSKSVEPALVTVQGPEAVVESLESIPARMIQVEDGTQPVVQEVTLDAPQELEVTPGAVTVTLDIAVRTEEWSPMVRVEVHNLSDYEVVSVVPERVRMHFALPVTLSDDPEVADSIHARTVVGRLRTPGEHAVVLTDVLPEGARFIAFEPESVVVALGEERVEEQTFSVPVTLDNRSGLSVASVVPDTVLVHVQVPVSMARREITSTLMEAKAFIPAGTVAGTHVLDIRGVVPEGAQVISVEPQEVEIRLEQ